MEIETTVPSQKTNRPRDSRRDTNLLSNSKDHRKSDRKSQNAAKTSKYQNEIEWEEYRTFPGVCAFIVFMCISIFIAVMVVYFTSRRQTNENCAYIFKRSAQRADGYNARPHDVTVGDLNNDTHLDIVVTNSGMDNIGIYLGFGNGSFVSQMNYSTGLGSRPYGVDVGDFNNDQLLDIVVAHYATNTLGVFLAYGNISFSSQIITSLGSSHPLALDVGYINNDTLLDVVIANYGTLDITILHGYNNGSFRIDLIYDMGYDSIPYSLIIADFNHDHCYDIGVVNYGTNELVILMNDQNQSFIMQKYYTGNNSHPCSIAVGDVNNDNAVDVIIANSANSSVGIFIGYGNGSFGKQTRHSTGIGSHPQYVVVGNLNKNDDNNTDVIVIDSVNNDVLVMKGYGNGSLSIMTTRSTGYNSQPISIDVGDFDHDNIPDIVITNNNTNNILILTTFMIYPNTSQTIYPTGIYSSPTSVAVGDLNNDTYVDIVVANSGTHEIGIFMGIGDGTFSDQEIFFLEGYFQPQFVAVADFNNDNNLDIAVAMFNFGLIAILFGIGNGTMTYGDIIFIGNNLQLESLGVGDFNNDTNLDIVTTDSQNGNVYVILRYNDGTYPNIIVYLTNYQDYAPMVAIGDLNNDDILDFVVGRPLNKTIGIYIGYGNGSFHDSETISVDDNNPLAVVIGDLNNDNQSDIVFTSGEPSNVGILFGNGNGTFGNLTVYFTGYGAGAFRVALGDFNNDTRPDIAVVNNKNGNIGIFLSYGNGTFAPQKTFSTGYGSFPYSIAFGDFNNDKQSDIVVCNIYVKNIGVFLVHYDANFLNQSSYLSASGPHPYSIGIADFNNDNHTDIVVANSGNDNIGIFFTYNRGIFLNSTIYSTGMGSHPQNVIVTDFDKDNQFDIIVANYWNDNIDVYLGKGNGQFDTPKSYSTGLGSFPNFMISTDINNDNWTDVIVANQGANNIGVFVGFNYASFTTRNIYLTGNSPSPGTVAVADFNNDNKSDIVIADTNAHTINFFFGYGNGTFTAQISYFIDRYSDPIQILIADFNNDKQLDIIFTDFAFKVNLLLGYGNGTFRNSMLFIMETDSPTSIAAGDFNNDSQLDIVVLISIADEINIYLGYGNGSFIKNITYYMNYGATPISVTVGDLNNDTILDIVVANSRDNNIAILLGYGDGTFMDARIYFTGNNSYPCSVVIGDLNKDNLPDIAVANQAAQNIGIFFGYGNGSFPEQTVFSTGTQSGISLINVFDLNNDNVLDIIVTDSGKGNGNIGVFYGLGNGTFAILKSYPTGFNSEPVAVAFSDFNNDKQVDIVVSLNKNASIAVMLRHKTEPFAIQTTCSTGNDSQPTSVAVANIDNDQYADIIVTNSGTDNILILFGYGNGSFHNQLIYPTGSDSNPFSVTTGDFNHDHHIDIAYVNAGIDTLDILLNYGNGTFYHFITYSTGLQSEPSFITSNYLDKDQDLDLVVANWGTNNILIYYGLSNGTFLQPKIYTLGYDARPTSIAIGDIDNNGLLDLAVANSASDYVEILLQIC